MTVWQSWKNRLLAVMTKGRLRAAPRQRRYRLGFDQLESRTVPTANVTGLDPASDTGSSNTDGITNDATPTIVGTAIIDSQVSVLVDNVEIGTTTANSSGDWTFTPTSPLNVGPRSITASDSGGVGTALSIEIDTDPPAAPVVTTVDSDSGTSNSDFITNDNTPIISGTTTGSVVTLKLGANVITTTTADINGNWAINRSSSALDPGAYTVTTTDLAGNESVASAQEIIIDNTAPAAPVVTSVTDDSGSNDFITNDTTPSISGTAEVDTTVTVKRGSTVVGTATAGAGGTWTIDLTTVQVDGTYTVTATDAAGNESAASAQQVVIDSAAPAAPTIASVTEDSGNNTADLVTNDTTPIINGTAEAGSTVTLKQGSTAITTAVTNSSGAWTIDRSDTALANGTYTVTATDAAGNESAVSARQVVIDSTGATPALPVIASVTGDSGSSSSDRITNDTTPVITGTADANATVTLKLGSTVIDTTTATAGGAWSIDRSSAALAEGAYTVTQTVNGVESGVALQEVVIDTTATLPVVTSVTTDSGASSTDFITNDTTPVITGTAEAGSTVTLNLGSTVITTAVTNSSGVWTIDRSTTALATGTYTVTATDAAGNESAVAAQQIVIDTSVPAAPVIASVTADSGISGNDLITNDTLPVVTGTAVAGSLVEIKLGTTVLGSDTADQNGDWSIDLTGGPALVDGTYTVTAKDEAGNESPAAAQQVVIDTTAPAPPEITSVTEDTGTNTADLITTDTTPVVSGTAAPNSRVTLKLGTTFIEETIANASGQWTIDLSSINPALGDGAYTATATDAAGNESAASTDQVLIDAAGVLPAVPVIVSVIDNSGSSTDLITSDRTPIISGTSDPNATITLKLNGTTLTTTTANGSGLWTFDFSGGADQGEGNYTVTATLNGNESAPSAQVVVLDSTAPAAPVITSVTDDTGTSMTDLITNDTTPTISGTAEANSTVRIKSGTTVVGTVTADGSGAWTFTPASALTPGIFTATALDAAGNESAVSAQQVELDTTPLAAPVIVAVTDDSGSSNTDLVTNDTTPIISGAAPANAIVRLKFGTTIIATTTSDANGAWSFNRSGGPVLAAGTYTTTTLDTAGNESASSSQTIVIDPTAPAAPTLLTLSPTSDSGTLGDRITNDATPTIAGNGEVGATIRLLNGAFEVGQAVVGSNGTWSITTSALAEGSHVLTARATDAAGNVSPASTALILTVDISPPNPPAPPTLAAGSDNGVSSSDNITSITTPTLTGTAGAGQTVRIFDGAALLGSVTANAGGVWSFTPTSPLSNGSHNISVTATDAAGNESLASAPLAVTVDSTGLVSNPIRNVTDQVQVRKQSPRAREREGPRRNRIPTFRQFVTITNRTDQVIEGPLTVVIAGLDSRFRVKEPDGTRGGNPFVQVDTDGLAPGESITVTLKFQYFGDLASLPFDAARGVMNIAWNARVFAGLDDGNDD